MSGATLWVLGMLACTAIAIAPLPSSEMIDPESTRARAIRRSELRITATVAAFSVCAVAATYALGRGHWGPITPLAIGLVVVLLAIHPWIVARFVAIPLGLPRLAWAIGRLGGYPWVSDPEGGAVLSGALACARKRKHDPEACAWLLGKLRADRVRGAGIVAAGLLAADAGDRARARALLVSLEQLDPDLCPALARRIALDWLVADDACEGRWSAIASTPDDVPIVSRTARFFTAAARRLSGSEALGSGTLTRRWLVAPRRLATAPLWVRALSCAPPTRLDASRSNELAPQRGAACFGTLDPIDARFVSVLPANDGGPSHAEPVTLHLEAMTEPDGRERADTRLLRLGQAWDQAFEGFELRRRIRERTNALEGGTLGELATARLQRDVVRDLAAMMRRDGVESLGELLRPRSTIARARIEAREQLSQELAAACAAMGEQRSKQRVPVPIDAWLAVLEVQDRYTALARATDLPERREAFAIVEIELRQTAAWFWNDLSERSLANAVCMWLLLEAERVHDTDSAAYHRFNSALVV